jgi:hypothetical protein
MTKKPAKETKALTPAKKPAKTVRKTAVAAAPAAKAAPAPIAPAPAAPVAAPAPVAKPVAPKPVAPKVVTTTISASFDVGFGNQLHIRGEGPGLSWDKGVALENVKADKWSITVREATKPIVFKLLINDEVWSGGEDYVLAPGGTAELTPTFPGW